MDYNHTVNENVENEREDFIEKTSKLGRIAISYYHHCDGFGTEELAVDFIDGFEELLGKSQKALEALKLKLQSHYPNLK